MTSTFKWRFSADGRVTRTQTTKVEHVFERKPGGWQLPCGCIGPDIMTSEDAGESYCTFCGRGWIMMGRYSPLHRRGSDLMCAMIDGNAQGQPVLILMNPLP